jgi:DNA-binding LytR/AlgR family response regulator
LPDGADPARLTVCERSGTWAVALRAALADAGVRVHETRTLAECWEALDKAPASFLVVEMTAGNAAELIGRLARARRDFPLARVAVVAERAMRRLEWLVREAGAVDFTCSPRRLAPLAQTACRHLAAAPAPPQSFVEQVWARLPWKRQASDPTDARLLTAARRPTAMSAEDPPDEATLTDNDTTE